MSSMAFRSSPPQVIEAYPRWNSAGAGLIGLSKYDKSIGGYTASGKAPTGNGVGLDPGSVFSASKEPSAVLERAVDAATAPRPPMNPRREMNDDMLHSYSHALRLRYAVMPFNVGSCAAIS